jgi:uncharacterized membrane protein
MAMAAWTALLFSVARSDYRSFRFARFDLGNMVQAVWSTAHGRPLEMTLASGEQSSRLASHVDPILALLAPLWLVWPSPLMLAFVQIAACALGALPVFWLARKHLASETAAGLMALVYLAYPWLAWTALDAMHPVTLAIPLFLYAIWFLDTGRVSAFAACAGLTLMTGELMGLPIACLGLWYWIGRGERRAGLAIAATGFAWSVIAVKVVVPHFNGAESPYYDYYAEVGGSPEAVLGTLVTEPATIAAALFSSDDFAYVVMLGVPLLGAFAFAPGLALAAVPQLLVNGLNGVALTLDPRHHYIAAILPFLVAASVLGLARLRATWQTLLPIGALAVSSAIALLVAPWPSAPWMEDIASDAARRDFTYTYLKSDISAARARAFEEALRLVPNGAPVAATNRLGLRLSERRRVYSVPVVGDAEWVVLDTHDAWVPRTPSHEAGISPKIVSELESKLRLSSSWRTILDREGVAVFERVTAG